MKRLEKEMWEFDRRTGELCHETDQLIVYSTSIIAGNDIENDQFVNGYDYRIIGNIHTGLIFNNLKRLATNDAGYQYILLELAGYYNLKDVSAKGNEMNNLWIEMYKTRDFKCDKSKECGKDSTVCLFEKYAQASNVSEKIKKRYHLEDFIAETIKHTIFENLMKCSSNFPRGKIIITGPRY